MLVAAARADDSAWRARLPALDPVRFIQQDGVGLVRQGREKWVGLCPFHAEEIPSFTVYTDPARGWFCYGCKDGGDLIAYVQRRRECGFREALTYLGLTPGPKPKWVPLAPPANGPPPARAVATWPDGPPGEIYDYVDAGGILRYQVLRWALPGGKKTFRQRRPDDRGGWIHNLQGTAPLLYHLPELLTADPARPVLVTEGEKDADALIALGYLATCNSGGAGRWPSGYGSPFAGRTVLLIPDNDPAGRQHMADVAATLTSHAALLVTLELPDVPQRGDASDYLARHGAGAFAALVNAALLSPNGQVPPAPPAGGGPLATGDISPKELRTDYGNAERLVRSHGADLHWTQALGWLVWDGARWARDDTGAVMRRAKATVRAMYAESWGLPDEEGAALRKHTAQSESAGALSAMIKLAESEAAIALPIDAFDDAPWLLTCANGTLDLRIGQLRPHDRADLITRTTTAPYRPAAPCPTWIAFLDRVFAGDSLLIEYVQRVIGYALTGSTREQCMFMLYGTGANGKSTFLQALQGVLGDYAQNTPAATLLVRPDGAATNDLARLAGARLVAAMESEEGKRLAEALIKQMTGGDKLVARYLRQEFFEFTPVFKLLFATNHRPTIRGTDAAIWRRIHLIPFTVTIPPAERDATLAERLQAEAAGILAWAVAGCLSWQTRGLAPPRAVVDATEGYRADMDLLSQFLAECCIIGDARLKVTVKHLYSAYAEWCKQNGERELTNRAFSQRLHERGLHNARVGAGGAYTWFGIGLVEE